MTSLVRACRLLGIDFPLSLHCHGFWAGSQYCYNSVEDGNQKALRSLSQLAYDETVTIQALEDLADSLLCGRHKWQAKRLLRDWDHRLARDSLTNYDTSYSDEVSDEDTSDEDAYDEDDYDDEGIYDDEDASDEDVYDDATSDDDALRPSIDREIGARVQEFRFRYPSPIQQNPPTVTFNSDAEKHLTEVPVTTTSGAFRDSEHPPSYQPRDDLPTDGVPIVDSPTCGVPTDDGTSDDGPADGGLTEEGPTHDELAMDEPATETATEDEPNNEGSLNGVNVQDVLALEEPTNDQDATGGSTSCVPVGGGGLFQNTKPFDESGLSETFTGNGVLCVRQLASPGIEKTAPQTQAANTSQSATKTWRFDQNQSSLNIGIAAECGDVSRFDIRHIRSPSPNQQYVEHHAVAANANPAHEVAGSAMPTLLTATPTKPDDFPQSTEIRYIRMFVFVAFSMMFWKP